MEDSAMQITITAEQEQHINLLVKTGGYNTPVDLLSDALAALEEKQTMTRIGKGIRQIREGKGVPAEDVFSRLNAKYKAML